ncbi:MULTISPECIES: CDC27 family protein [unclassified Halobacteriovorax]|uniref:CDC27 family protein n=1 Tax=unclassified Halobacteriovorax TaxID=2639665 RepID=UPI002FEFE892
MENNQEIIKDVMFEFFFNDNQFTLSNYVVYKFKGEETREYLQRQITADISGLDNAATIACRLDRTGRVFSFFYLIHNNDGFYLAVDEKISEETIEELEKFIIMEDITIEKTQKLPCLSTRKGNDFVTMDLFDGVGYIGLVDEKLDKKDYVNFLEVLTAWPILDKTIDRTKLINETRLNEFAISYNKGCFLGQETASKIESRRGAARYPVLLTSNKELADEVSLNDKKVEILNRCKIGETHFSVAKAPRELLINNLEVSYQDDLIKINTYPVLAKENIKEEISEYYYNKAVNLFHKNKITESLSLLDQVISFNPLYADAYESKGVILGNSGEHQKAIDVMDELLAVDESSVMAHTNKSLYLMKLGKIEEAEEEKALATVASFKRFGDEAKAKKAKEEQERAEKEERARRFEMFNKVLAIDENDVVANFGLADIHFNNEKFEKALKHLEVVLNENPKYSVAYLLKSKILFSEEKYEQCLEVIEKGIPIATSQGELMPANEMQTIKSKVLRKV